MFNQLLHYRIRSSLFYFTSFYGKRIKNSMMDADNNQDINQHDEEGSCTSENEIDVF
jgi:hypothetical protein